PGLMMMVAAEALVAMASTSPQTMVKVCSLFTTVSSRGAGGSAIGGRYTKNRASRCDVWGGPSRVPSAGADAIRYGRSGAGTWVQEHGTEITQGHHDEQRLIPRDEGHVLGE